MNKQEFFDKLEEHSAQYHWYIGNQTIRGIEKGTAKIVCPITAVIHSELGIEEPMWNALQAAVDHLGMSFDEANSIELSADSALGTHRQTLLSLTCDKASNRKQR